MKLISPSLHYRSWRLVDCGKTSWLCDGVAMWLLNNRRPKGSYRLEVSTAPLKGSKRVYLFRRGLIFKYSREDWGDTPSLIFHALGNALRQTFGGVLPSGSPSPMRVYARLVRVKRGRK